MENVYNALKEKFEKAIGFTIIFRKAKIDHSKTLYEIYEQIATEPLSRHDETQPF